MFRANNDATSFRAPVLLGYPGNQVGNSVYGTEYTQDFTNTLWTISAPFNDAVSSLVLSSFRRTLTGPTFVWGHSFNTKR